MPGGKSTLLYAAAPSALFSVSLPDGAVALCTSAGGLAPTNVFLREPSEALLCLATPNSGAKGTLEAVGALVQLNLGTSDPDEATGEPANDDCANQLWSGPAAARTAVILDTDSGAHRVVLAAGEGLQVYDVGVGSWQRCPGFDGVQVQSLDFALDAASGARLLVAGGWRLGSGPQLLLSRGAMAGTPATACEWLVRDLPSSGPASVMGPMGSCLVRVDPANPQRLYALVLPSPVNRSSQAPAPAGDMEAAWPARPAAGGDVLCVSHDLGATWQVQMVTGRATPLLRLTGLALSANRPGRLMLTGTIPALAPGHVPVGSQDGITPDRPVVLYSADAGMTFQDLSAAVAEAAEPGASAARERHHQLEQQHPGHAAHRHLPNTDAVIPLFVHTTAVVALPDGQLLFNTDVEAGSSWHVACQLPAPVAALSCDDGLSAPSALMARG